MKRFNIICFLASFLLLVGCSESNDVIDLSGQWAVRLDSMNATKSYIDLPGTTDEAGLGNKTRDTAYGILSREYEFIGKAWYSRDLSIPENWENQHVSLFLERVLWQSRVFIDQNEVDMQDALGTPHVHQLGKLTPGQHELTVLVNNDMVHNIGDKGHAYGEYMQSIWNGIVGKIELRADPDIRIESVKTFPDIRRAAVDLKIELSKAVKDLPLLVVLREKQSGRKVGVHKTKASKHLIETTIRCDDEVQTWDEFNPFLYEVEVIIDPDGMNHQHTTTFGFCEVKKDEHHILINGNKTYLRGNLDCVHFPNTGYPSTKKEDWLDIFQTYKDYGLNHVRYHSWCPPEAAFEAADELGIYIQAEASVWIDWWMGTDMVARGRPEMETKGHPQGIGQGDADADEFIWQEMNRVVDTYGNHPSFILFCIGNELGSSDFNVMGEWIRKLKEKDPRRLYAASTARTITDYCDYSATHNVPGIGGVRQRMFPNTNWSYEDRYSQATVPIIAHEIGQWPVYPDWDEIEKYNGPLKPRNLKQLANLAKKNGVFEKAEAYRQASGSLSALLYKDEIESFMRTPSCAGFQLLSMQDYIGQGEALIGWLDSFYEEKGNLDPKTARQFLNEVVPLAELPGYCFRQKDSLEIPVKLFQFAAEDLPPVKINWVILDANHERIDHGSFQRKGYTKGQVHEAGLISWTIPQDIAPGKYQLQIGLSDTDYRNTWPIWIYAEDIPEIHSDIIICDSLSPEILAELEGGSSVFFMAAHAGAAEYTANAAWKPLYWSASFFPGQAIETLGTIVDTRHPAIAGFSTDDFANWNWYRLCDGARCFDLKDFSKDFQPIIEPVSDFHYCKRLGSLFEVKVGAGKLIVCGYDVLNNPDNNPEVSQLKYSILNYMTSDAFNPNYQIDISVLKNMFNLKTTETENKNNPQELPGGNKTN